MMENRRAEKENIIKGIRNIFRQKKGLNQTAIKNIRSLFRPKKETLAIKGKIIRDIKNISEFEKEEKNYYKPVRVNNALSNSYIEYKSNSDGNKHYKLKNILIKLD